ncbi:hypothetical protein BF49_2588 [Bradyrhizobium sp.]|nr:hypothetical protein BF49_2588 [Bradyrhizobium sp.]
MSQRSNRESNEDRQAYQNPVRSIGAGNVRRYVMMKER